MKRRILDSRILNVMVELNIAKFRLELAHLRLESLPETEPIKRISLSLVQIQKRLKADYRELEDLLDV